MSILSTIGSILGGPIKDLTETRKATKAARMEAELKKIEAQANLEIARMNSQAKIAEKQAEMESNWELETVRQASTSWKDEYWTIVLSLPLILSFIPTFDKVVQEGFASLALTPTWYQAAVMAAISFAFGLRALNKFTNWKGKNNG